MTDIEKDARALADFHRFFAGKEETLSVMFGIEALTLFLAAKDAAQRHATPQKQPEECEQ